MTIQAGGMALTALTLLLGAGPAVAGGQDGCYSDDAACRLTRVEARVASLERALEQLERTATRPQPRSVTIPVEIECRLNNCAIIARATCSNAGFARGAPATIATTGSVPRLVTAVCMD